MKKITTILIATFSALIFIFLCFGLYWLYNVNTISHLTRTIYDHPLVVSNAALEAEISITRMHRNMKDVVLFTEPERIVQSIAEVEGEEQSVYENLDIIKENILGAEGSQLERETRAAFTEWRPIRAEVIALVRSGRRAEAAEITSGKGAAHVRRLEALMTSMKNYARVKASTFITQVEKAHLRIHNVSVALLVVSIIVSFVVCFFAVRRILKMEKELWESRQLLFNGIDNAAIGMVLVDPKGTFYQINKSFCEMLGYEEKELQHMTFRDITHKDDIEIGNKVIKRLIDGEETRHERLEKRYVRKDGTIIDTSLTTSLIRDISGAPQYFFTQIVDITERKRGEDKLRETQGLLEAAMDASHAGIAIADAPSGRLRYVNKAGLNIAGEDRENLVNGVESAHYAETWQIMDLDGRLLDPDEIPLARAVMFGETNSREFVIRRQSGDERIVAANAAPVRNALDEVFAGVVVFLDITERKRAEQRLEHLNQVLRSIRDINQLIVRERDPETLIAEGCRLLVENRGFASVVIILTDPGGQVTGWAASGSASDESEKIADMIEQNEIPACCAIAPSDNEVVVIDKRSDLCRQCPLLVTHTNAPSLCARLSHGGNVYGFIIAALNFDMTVDEEERDLFVEIAGDFAYAINFIRMEAEALLSAKQRDKMQAQLIQAQKMESVGRLAGGVAHDYNNMLTIIIGYAEMALDKVVPDDALHTDISEIFNAAQRSSEITKQLLAFSRQQTTQPRIIDLNETIDKTLKMLRRLIGEDIDLAWMPSPNVWSVYVDPVQIDQILANLCANARDAIDGTGQVTIETKNVTFDQDYCATHAGFLPGEYVHIGVSDNGSGMSAETRDKVFEPFFTTKELHQGTGLGLATVYGIIKQNNGFINVYSEPGKGTTIKNYLPRYIGEAVEVDHLVESEIPVGNGETVLLVEDDGSILKLGKKMLESLGYKALTAQTPGEAMAIASDTKQNVDLLLSDVVMPEMNGRELSEKITSLRPEIKTLFMSGYTANVIAHRGVLDEGINFIEKPLSRRALAISLRNLLT